jgi:LysR family transcriptional regulator, nitrogen assimilation regulatory protein
MALEIIRRATDGGHALLVQPGARIIDPPLTRSCALVSLANRPQTKAFLEVRKTVAEAVRSAVSEGRWPAKGNSRRSKRTVV